MTNTDRFHAKSRILLLSILIIILAIMLSFFFLNSQKDELVFDADLAYEHVLAQVGFGPRTPGSDAHAQAVLYIHNELEKSGWKVEVQETVWLGHPVKNIIAKKGSGEEWIILGAHYDSRLVADRDETIANRSLPVLGANDGASGVAVLLEMARVFPTDLDTEVWLVFFDLEDQGRIEGWDWIIGSQAFVHSLEETPDAVVVIDMIGDADLNIHREKSSSPALVDEIWQQAASLGYEEYFINTEKFAILDDHTPFLSAGMTAIDIIDFDYPFYHTVDDTADKVSPHSLKVIGDVLLAWLTQ